MKDVLIVVDMQNDFIDGALGSAEAQKIVPNVVKKIADFHGDVIMTKDTHEQDYLETQEGKNLPVEHCIKGSGGWMLHPDILQAMKDKGQHIEVLQKPTFGSVGLVGHLMQRIREVERVTLVGLCTDICVISNAMLIKTFLPEVEVAVDASCCAGVTPESHSNALAAMKMCQIKIENWEG